MDIRIFQVLTSFIAILFIVNMTNNFRQSKIDYLELLLGVLFSLTLLLFAIFPDIISITIAKILGIESNINAVIFLSIIFLFFFQLKIFLKLKRQEKILTILTRQFALKDVLKEEDL